MMHRLSPFLFALIFFLSGCTVKSDAIPSESPIVSDQSEVPSIESSQQEKSQDTSHFYDYTVAAAFDMVTRGSGNEDGFYQVIPNTDGYANLFYTDYATASRVYGTVKVYAQKCLQTPAE